MFIACPDVILYFELPVTAPFSPCWQSIWQYNLPQTCLTSFNIHISFLRILQFAAFVFSYLTSLLSLSLDITGVHWTIQVRWKTFRLFERIWNHTLSRSLLWVKGFCQLMWQPCLWFHTLKNIISKTSQLYLVMGEIPSCKVPKLYSLLNLFFIPIGQFFSECNFVFLALWQLQPRTIKMS